MSGSLPSSLPPLFLPTESSIDVFATKKYISYVGVPRCAGQGPGRRRGVSIGANVLHVPPIRSTVHGRDRGETVPETQWRQD